MLTYIEKAGFTVFCAALSAADKLIFVGSRCGGSSGLIERTVHEIANSIGDLHGSRLVLI